MVFDETQITSKDNRSNPKPGDPSHPITAEGRPPTLCFKGGQGAKAGGIGVSESLAPMLGSAPSGTQQSPALMQGMAVRRLTPVECERLQGFPDNWTCIPYRGKPAEKCADGPRYKAIGNSMAVPVITWLGRQIEAVDQIP